LNANDTTLDTTSHNSTATRDREYVFDWHQEWLVGQTNWFWDVAVQSFNQFTNGSGAHFVVVFAFQRHTSRTDDDRSVVAWEVVSAQQIAHFHLNQFQQLSVVYQVTLFRKTTMYGTPT